MKKLLFAAAFAGICNMGQAQELPAPSPQSEMHQRVGLTDVVVKYSRPSAKEREIFGALVPYGELWRTGANMATTITFSTPIMIGEQDVPAGTYALFTIPGEDEWTIIINKNAKQSGTSQYDEEMDVARVSVEPMYTEEHLETFTIDVQNLRNESALLVLGWENTRVGVPFEVRTMETAEGNIALALEETPKEDMWRVYRNAANFYLNNDTKLDLALEYINASIAQNRDSWYSYLVKAEILADLEEYDRAIETAGMAIKVGQKMAQKEEKEFGYEEMISNNISKWEKMEG